MIGIANTNFSPDQAIRYDRLRSYVRNAYALYPNTTVPNDAYVKTKEYKQFNEYMAKFYTEGKRNPAVAKMILMDEINKCAKVKECRESIEKIEDLKSDINKASRTMLPAQGLQARIPSLQLTLDSLALRGEEQKYIQAVHTQMEDRLSYETKILRRGFVRENFILYPKTYAIREILISCGRIALDFVKQGIPVADRQKMIDEFLKSSMKFSKIV